MAVHLKAEETVIRIDDEEEPKSKSMKFTQGEKSKSKAEGNSSSKKKFKQFDVIAGTRFDDLVSDHKYKFLPSTTSNPKPSQLRPETISVIMKEWNILNDNLPDSIFVRAYEGRIDLLRAVVIGPPGTPYHGGLFFYDICIPCDYPYEPPILCFIYPVKLRLNPSLNPDMIVCCNETSCTGKKKKKHSILDSLLWLQANIITSEPKRALDHSYVIPTYWGYWLEREHLTFNQEIFMLNCETIMATLFRPPRHFEKFVVQHFRDHAESILTACKPYIVDQNPSKADENASSDEHRIQIGDLAVSPVVIEEEIEGYKKSIKGIYLKLVEAFIWNGSPKSLKIDYNVGDIISDAIDDKKKKSKAEWKLFCQGVLLIEVLGIIFFFLVLGLCSLP